MVVAMAIAQVIGLRPVDEWRGREPVDTCALCAEEVSGGDEILVEMQVEDVIYNHFRLLLLRLLVTEVIVVAVAGMSYEQRQLDRDAVSMTAVVVAIAIVGLR